MTTERDLNFPSGVRLPYILRRKLEQQQQQAQDSGGASSSPQEQQTPPSATTLPEHLLDRAFTAEELEKQIIKTSVARAELQKQVQRGEEVYYEETYGHGSIFKGWEGFLDARDMGVSSSATGPGVGSGSRRVPVDFRWFSGSCKSVSRTNRPAPIQTASWPQAPGLQVPRSVSSTGVTPKNSATPAAAVAATQAATPTSTTIPTPVTSASSSLPTTAASGVPAAPVPAITKTATLTTAQPAATTAPKVAAAATPGTTPRASPGPTPATTVPVTTTTTETDSSAIHDFKIPKKKSVQEAPKEASNTISRADPPPAEKPATLDQPKKRGRKRKSVVDASG